MVLPNHTYMERVPPGCLRNRKFMAKGDQRWATHIFRLPRLGGFAALALNVYVVSSPYKAHP
jgi:hypothetical protein